MRRMSPLRSLRTRNTLIPLAIGAGRAGVGLAFAVNPVQSVRFLGVDTGTARRLTWLAQMAAARDLALGVGTVAAVVRGQGSGAWLLAGAACDAADAAALGSALARRQVSPPTAAAVIGVAVAASATAVAATLRAHRQPMVTLVT